MVKFKIGDALKITDNGYKDFKKYANYTAVIDNIDKGNKLYHLNLKGGPSKNNNNNLPITKNSPVMIINNTFLFIFCFFYFIYCFFLKTQS